ncbi:WXG100 family type VII secretion target [Ligilactobacillus hohenheimensis]|uniref:WXG100 family type VII secretion target n=1 Tax=Ligilactobacillus hohenheimensis TaxID=2991832 RepID=UPI001F94AEC9|nr:WXG100 family type VII secretion target [Ligilactobacillus hohenheimensis]HJC03728.1 WXG100 family type VII secretion target [Candidatus Ligilactobacillus avistercoris]
MAMIKMTPEQMQQYATKYGQSSQQISDMLGQLKSLQSQISADWQGQGFQRFDQEFNQLCPKIQQFAQLLQEIDQKLKQSAQAMSDTDQQIASQFN